jgi:hypothetical protein
VRHPRASLGSGGVFDELACPECIEWLPKRAAVTGKYRMGHLMSTALAVGRKALIRTFDVVIGSPFPVPTTCHLAGCGSRTTSFPQAAGTIAATSLSRARSRDRAQIRT